jgi:hypothetical protein
MLTDRNPSHQKEIAAVARLLATISPTEAIGLIESGALREDVVTRAALLRGLCQSASGDFIALVTRMPSALDGLAATDLTGLGHSLATSGFSRQRLDYIKSRLSPDQLNAAIMIASRLQDKGQHQALANELRGASLLPAVMQIEPSMSFREKLRFLQQNELLDESGGQIAAAMAESFQQRRNDAAEILGQIAEFPRTDNLDNTLMILGFNAARDNPDDSLLLLDAIVDPQAKERAIVAAVLQSRKSPQAQEWIDSLRRNPNCARYVTLAENIH